MATADEYELLRTANKENTPRHNITGLIVGKIVDAYDGDTCRLAISVPLVVNHDELSSGTKIEYLNIRMLGYDAPEMKKHKGKDHKPYGTEVREVLRHLVLGKIVIAHIPETKKPDPYGRTLAHLYVAERGSILSIPKRPSRCCCMNFFGSMQRILVSDGESSKVGNAEFEVRKQAVVVPHTADVPEGYYSAEGLLHVNAWIIDNARVKVYDGAGGRPDYTSDELENGV